MTMIPDPRQETAFTFPCRFPIKAMGRADSDFEALVLDLVGQHVEGLDASDLHVRRSREGRWVSVTITIEARSRQQLDAIYTALSAHERVRWAL